MRRRSCHNPLFLPVVPMAPGLAAIVLRSEGRRSLLEPGSALMILVSRPGLLLLHPQTGRTPGGW